MGGCQECAGHSRHSPVFSMSLNLNGTGTKMDQTFKMFQFWSKAAAGTKSLRSIHLPGFFRMHSAQVLWVDNGITQRTSEELLWAWSPSVMFFFFCHVFVIIPRHVDRRPSLPGAFRRATRASSMAIFWEGKCVMQAGRVGDFFVS